MSKRHEERARKLHARLTASMRAANGDRKHSVEDVTRLEVTASENGGIAVSFRYSDGTESEIDFAPDANAYDMAREAKRHAVGRCSEIREARHNANLAAERAKGREAERAARAAAFEERIAALPAGASLTGDDADDALEYVQEQIEARGGDVIHRAMTAKPGDVAVFAPGDGGEGNHVEVLSEERAAELNAEALKVKIEKVAETLPDEIREELAKPDVRTEAREYARRRAEDEDREYRQALRARVTEALALHSPLEPREIRQDNRVAYEVDCRDCAYMATTFDRPLAAFAEHQADVVLDLI